MARQNGPWGVVQPEFAVMIAAPRQTLLTVEEDLRFLRDAIVPSGSERLDLKLQLSEDHQPLRDDLAAALRNARISGEAAPFVGFQDSFAADLFDVLDRFVSGDRRQGLHGLMMLNELLGMAYSAHPGCRYPHRIVQLDVQGIQYLPPELATDQLPIMNRQWAQMTAMRRSV